MWRSQPAMTRLASIKRGSRCQQHICLTLARHVCRHNVSNFGQWYTLECSCVMAKAAGAEPKRLSCTVCRLTTQVVALGHANVVGENSRQSFFNDRHLIPLISPERTIPLPSNVIQLLRFRHVRAQVSRLGRENRLGYLLEWSHPDIECF